MDAFQASVLKVKNHGGLYAICYVLAGEGGVGGWLFLVWGYAKANGGVRVGSERVSLSLKLVRERLRKRLNLSLGLGLKQGVGVVMCGRGRSKYRLAQGGWRGGVLGVLHTP